MGDWKLALAWIGVIIVVLLDNEDGFYRLIHGDKTNIFTVLKIVVATATLIWSMLGIFGKI